MSDTQQEEQTNKQPNSQGDHFVKLAEKRLKSISIFNPTKLEDALELYEKAITQYKLTKNWYEAAQSSVKCAELCEKRNE